MTERTAMLHGDTVYRIHWKLGTDLLVGVCYCGAEHESEDPVELWEWLLAHPDGHDGPAEPAGDPVLAGAGRSR
ncbi:hypothetical protein GCM10017786_69880 [Amycolatopsis deserti]|uniref:Uncharacterized protein n=1 Tax=Amycolatopsis deserti TaxID=185696 RepID=A0ABQ3JJN2_9PSEU|nr:hypothetical protein [Amycolatopsis deserti]GHF25721.1 hypothetical protein GCM10017786_69880 [Amycolatopsis deserti]